MKSITITTIQLKRVVSAFGYLPDGSKTWRTHLYTMHFLLYLIDLIGGLSHEWDNFNIRLEIIKDLMLIFNLEIYWLSFPDVYILLGIFERHRLRLKKMKCFKDLSRKFYEEIDGMEQNSEYFLKLIMMMHFLYSYIPFLNAVYVRLTFADNTNFKDVAQISYMHYPMTKEVSFHLYCFGALFIYIGFIYASVFTFCILYSSYLALHTVMAAFSQLRIFILEWDKMYAAGVAGATRENCQFGNIDEDCLREIIVFHQEICSEARLLNKGMETATMNLLQGCVVQICLSLFNILEGGDKIKYGGFTSFILLMLVGYSSFGQILEDRIARIKMTIWESGWLEKPLSVRKALLLMMIGASAQLELRPFGLLGLNIQSFAKVLRTVYSLFNVINHSSVT